MNVSRLLFSLAVATIWVPALCADLVVEYDGLAGVTQSAINGSGISGIDLTRGAGLNAAPGTTFNSNDFDTASTDVFDALISNDYLAFGFSVTGSNSLDVTDILVELDRSGTGPTDVFLLFDGDGDGFEGFDDVLQQFSIPDPGAVLTFNTGLPTGLTSADGINEFRFYFAGATNSAGTSDIEGDLIGGTTGNIGLQINGTFNIVPEPSSTILLLGFSILGLVRRRRA